MNAMYTTMRAAEGWVSAMRTAWTDLKSQATTVHELEPRAHDVLWPLFHYESIDIEPFEASTMCLLANEVDKKLYLNASIVADIYAQLASSAARAVAWFVAHQMVHVTQGLSYRTFRVLNEEPDRIETTRADVWADFISLKTLSILEVLGTGGREKCNKSRIRDQELALLRNVVWPMIRMRPNYFIPFEREFEAKRVLSLLVLGMLVEEVGNSDGNELIDDSIFANWRRDKTELYVWYGQTGLLGRRSIACRDNEIDAIIAAIRAGRIDEACERIRALPLPRGAELAEYCRRSVL